MAASTVALVTGSNTGIGEVVARRLAAEFSYHVIVAGRKAEACEKVAAEIRSSGGKASSLVIDLDNDETIDAALKRIETDFGKLDVLVNNAAIKLDPMRPGRSMREMYQQTLSTNLVGTAILTEGCTSLLRKSKEAPRVVFVSSSSCSITDATNPNSPFYLLNNLSYDASKAALNNYAMRTAKNLRDIGAMVNCACPGYTATKMVDFDPIGGTVDDAAKIVVKLATLEKGGPTATFQSRDGPVNW